MAISQPIVGTVLAWCVENSVETASQVESALRLEAGTLSLWIREEKAPNKGQLALLAKHFNRPSSFFFLPRPPETLPPRVEFRRFAGTDAKPGKETLEAIDLAKKLQKTTSWIRLGSDQASPSIPRLKVGDEVESSAQKLREWAGWSTSFQTGASSDAVVSKKLRTSLEAKGLIVMHASMEQGVTRGFSISDAQAPLLAINSKDPYRARMFSYTHELVHLATGSSAVCNVHEIDARLEKFCNRVAAAFLMPASTFRSHVQSRVGNKLSTVQEVSQVRARFKVSLRAAAIRAEHLGLATAGLFDLVDREAEVKLPGGIYIPGNERTKPVIRVDEYGRAFIREVKQGVDAGLLAEQQAASMLRLSSAEWQRAKSLAEGDAAA